MIDSSLRQMKSQGASDLFLCCGKRPALRIDGQLTTLSEEAILGVAAFNEFIERILSTPQQRRYLEDGDLDVGYSLEGDRYRLSLHRQSGQMALVAELRDSETGDLLARAVDTQRGRTTGSMQFTNNVTNTADARRAIGIWAGALRQGMGEMYGRTH